MSAKSKVQSHEPITISIHYWLNLSAKLATNLCHALSGHTSFLLFIVIKWRRRLEYDVAVSKIDRGFLLVGNTYFGGTLNHCEVLSVLQLICNCRWEREKTKVTSSVDSSATILCV